MIQTRSNAWDTVVILMNLGKRYVGNTMATFVMQALGCEVAALNTVHFSMLPIFFFFFQAAQQMKFAFLTHSPPAFPTCSYQFILHPGQRPTSAFGRQPHRLWPSQRHQGVSPGNPRHLRWSLPVPPDRFRYSPLRLYAHFRSCRSCRRHRPGSQIQVNQQARVFLLE